MILLDGVAYDLVVQQDWGDWLLADSGGTIYARFSTRERAGAALTAMEARLLARGGIAWLGERL